MSSLYSTRWHRVAGLTPQLAPGVRLRRQTVRGTIWYLLAEPASGRSVRLNPAAYAIAGRFDGRRSVEALWTALLERDADPATQDEVIELLARLREAGLIRFDRAADFGMLLPHLDRVARPAGRRTLMAWRVPLFNPARLLDRLRPIQRALFSRAALVVWCLAVATLTVLTLQNAPTLWAHGQIWMVTPRYALLALLLYAPIKLLHELAHGLAVRRWGGPVREAGVTLMLLVPVPYVDASAAAGFARRGPRIVVGAAGVMAELALAALALPLWLWLDDGLARDAAFVTLVIAGASTLLFNANPLQRLDGYYVLTDALDLPNLATRSREWWTGVLLRRVLRVAGVEPMPVARAETPWLAVYAPLAYLYGLAVAALAVVWLGQWSLALGLGCAALLGWQMLLRPPVQLARQLHRAALAQSASIGRWRRLGAGAAVLAVLLLALPLPQRSLLQGVVWPPDQAQLRAAEDGFVESLQVVDGVWVESGTAVLQLANPKLQADLARQSARVAALETELYLAMPGGARFGVDATRSGDAHADLAAAQVALARLTERLDGLTIRAPSSGRVALPDQADLPGRYLRRGSLVGHLLTGAALQVRVALPESEAGELRRPDRVVSVRLAGSTGVARPAQWLRDGGAAVLELPSAALSNRHGGAIQTDPLDAHDMKPLQPVVLLDVRLDRPDPAIDDRIGERAWVRFDAGWLPPALQLAQALRRWVSRHFNPQF